MTQRSKNRRREPRVTRRYPVRFWTRDWQGTGTVTNVSAGGLFVAAWPPVGRGEHFMFEAETERGAFAGAGEVTHVVGVAEKDARNAGMGVRLLAWADAVGVQHEPERVATPVDPDHTFGWSWRIW